MSRESSRRREPVQDNESMERWLLTYSDMMTLLLALFVILFSISSVNISKYQTLQNSLRAAFSGSILNAGRSILNAGADSSAAHSPNNTVIPPLVPLTPTIPLPVDQGAQQGQLTQAQAAALIKEAQQSSAENSEFLALEHRLNAYAKAHGFADQVQAEIQQRGLVITVLTDKLLFPSGSDTLDTASYPLLTEIATLIDLDTADHPVVVEGYTDSVPISNSQFPSNWWLSSGRANSVLQFLLGRDVPGTRLQSTGYGEYHAVASNATPAGRARNRRVEIVFERKYPVPNSGA